MFRENELEAELQGNLILQICQVLNTAFKNHNICEMEIWKLTILQLCI